MVKEDSAPGNQESPVNVAVTSPEDLRNKFEPPLNLFATQGFISNVDDASSTLVNLYFSNLLSFNIKMRHEKPPAVASVVSFSDIKINNKDKVEPVLTNKCVKLTS